MSDTSELSMGPGFRSEIPYENARIRAAAIYCSDGRVGEHFDHFLQDGLQLPRYDRIALPGGPACLAGHIKAKLNGQAVVEELKFLAEAHEITRVVLIAHESCAFYTARLNLEPPRLEAAQREDLEKSARFIYRSTGLSQIEAYFAHLRGDGVEFEPVFVDPLKSF